MCTKKKEILKILVIMSIFIFMTSCNNIFKFGDKKSKDDKKVEETQKKTVEEKEEKISKEYSGITVPLDDTNFSIENELLYHNKQLFTGRVTFTTNENYTGYFTFNSGVMEGVYEIKGNGNEEIGKINGNRSMYVKFKSNSGYEDEIEYDKSTGTIKKATYLSKKIEKSFNFSDKFSGEIKKDGKVYSFSEYDLQNKSNSDKENDSQNNIENQSVTKITIEEKDGVFVYDYNYDEEGDYVVITETKYKVDEKNYKYLIFMGLEEKNFLKSSKDMMKFFKTIFSDLQNISNTNVNQQTLNNSESNLNTTTNSQDNIVNNQGIDEDLATLDRVYNEVINKGNIGYLNNFSSDQLAIIRNTIYARKGYIFQKERYRNYFSRKSWYKGTSYSENIITPSEKRLAELILARE